MRRYLILFSAVFGLIGVAADQQAFRVDKDVSETQREREEFFEWQSFTAAGLLELNSFRQRLSSILENNGTTSAQYMEIIEYDALHYSRYMLEDKDWVENEEYEDLLVFDFNEAAENLVALEEIFGKTDIGPNELSKIRALTADLHKGMLIELVNVDEAVWGNRGQELELEFRRQIYLLIAIVSSLFSVLSVLLFVRTQKRLQFRSDGS